MLTVETVTAPRLVGYSSLETKTDAIFEQGMHLVVIAAETVRRAAVECRAALGALYCHNSRTVTTDDGQRNIRSSVSA